MVTKASRGDFELKMRRMVSFGRLEQEDCGSCIVLKINNSSSSLTLLYATCRGIGGLKFLWITYTITGKFLGNRDLWREEDGKRPPPKIT